MSQLPRVVLVRPRNPINIGAAARAMANFGFRDLAVVEPYEEAWREAKSAVGAEALLRTARSYASLAEAIADRTFVVGTTSGQRRNLRNLAPLAEVPARARGNKTALLFGSERTGLTNEQFGYCHLLTRIPTTPQCPSMNLAQAVAVCCYEWTRAMMLPPADRATAKSAQPAPMRDIEALREEWEQALCESGYCPTPPRPGDARRLRQLLLRLKLSRRDVPILRGMIAKFQWKMTHR